MTGHDDELTEAEIAALMERLREPGRSRDFDEFARELGFDVHRHLVTDALRSLSWPRHLSAAEREAMLDEVTAVLHEWRAAAEGRERGDDASRK